jgi:hypothetical protein
VCMGQRIVVGPASKMMYLTTRLEVLTLGEDALVVVDVVLPAVLGLVLVGEARIEACVACQLGAWTRACSAQDSIGEESWAKDVIGSGGGGGGGAWYRERRTRCSQSRQ